MAEAYIVEACRTPVGKRGGSLSKVHSADLGAHILKAVVERSGVDPNAVEDVIFGCIDQLGMQAGDIARTAWLVAGFSEDIPGVTIDRQCGSSQQAVHFAAQAVMSGTQDIVVAAGVESMTRVPMFSNLSLHQKAGLGVGPVSPRIKARYGVDSFSQFEGAEMMARKYGFDREALDRFALESHRHAAR